MSSFMQRKSGVGVCIESSELIALCRHRILHNKNEWMRLWAREAVLFTCKSCPDMHARKRLSVCYCVYPASQSLREKIYTYLHFHVFTAALARLSADLSDQDTRCIDVRWQRKLKLNIIENFDEFSQTHTRE